MKKIMFNDKYGLTRAVLEGRKTMTRRIILERIARRFEKQYGEVDIQYSPEFQQFTSFCCSAGTKPEDHLWVPYRTIAPCAVAQYGIGEEIAVAQAYKIGTEEGARLFNEVNTPGWGNKMFVKADLMPHRIRITNIKFEQLQDISDADCLREGIMKGEFINTWDTFYYDEWGDVANHITFKTPRKAFASLIDKVSGKGTWDANPWVFVYEFELVK